MQHDEDDSADDMRNINTSSAISPFITRTDKPARLFRYLNRLFAFYNVYKDHYHSLFGYLYRNVIVTGRLVKNYTA